MKFNSVIQQRGAVSFPSFMVERVYMREFYKDQGLPKDLSHWQGTVDAMLDGVDTDGPIYIMVDSTYVKAGNAQRREGLHIDGYWNPGVQVHSNYGGKGHVSAPSGGHSMGVYIPPRHNNVPHHSSGKWDIPQPGWAHSNFKEPEAIILASSLSAARGYVGEYEGPIGEGGDCSHVDLSGLSIVPMQDHRVYACNVTGLHETLPVNIDCHRQLVRLNVPGWTV